MKKTIKENIPHVSRQIGESTVVWFAASRSFVLFEQPTLEVFNIYRGGHSLSAIINHCCLAYNVTFEESQKFVNEVIEGINHLNDPASSIYHGIELPKALHDCNTPIFSEKFYLIGNKTIHFRYGNEWLMNCFHPTMAHLQSDSNTTEHLFDVFEVNNLLVFKYNGRVIEAFSKENSHFLRGSVLQKLYSVLYGIDDRDWMATLHAASVSDGKSSIIFPAQAGSGKSTLSAILKCHGLTVLSDDFITINRKNGFVYRLPLAISVKEGALNVLAPFYPELGRTSEAKAVTGKNVWYLPVADNLPNEPVAFQVKAFVFIKYSAKEPFVFERLDKKEAIQTLLPETWVSPDPENVAQFLNWVDHMSFYRLQYDDYKDALNAIAHIFNK